MRCGQELRPQGELEGGRARRTRIPAVPPGRVRVRGPGPGLRLEVGRAGLLARRHGAASESWALRWQEPEPGPAAGRRQPGPGPGGPVGTRQPAEAGSGRRRVARGSRACFPSRLTETGGTAVRGPGRTCLSVKSRCALSRWHFKFFRPAADDSESDGERVLVVQRTAPGQGAPPKAHPQNRDVRARACLHVTMAPPTYQ
jgi:hypothetical protein